MSEWQPIETAPEHTPILIYDPKGIFGPMICVAELLTKGWPSPIWNCVGASGYEWDNDFDKPTHWMPLPSPPEPKP